MGWALGMEGLTTKRISAKSMGYCRKRQKQRRKAGKSQAKEHATRGKPRTEE